ncbi:MAG TPA: secretin N-terminal domain-containing protein, partial [Candidatus Binataceae bacterium]|nr:secretin N-terminal domain-containing protein [Candidatus Binataceae bacterium]
HRTAIAAAALPARTRISVLSQRGSAIADEPSNTLIVTDVDRGLAAARQVISAIDRPAPQVEIESRIVETTDQYDRALGIQWGYSYTASSLTGNPTGVNFPGSVTIGGSTTSGLNNGVNPVTGVLIPFVADFPAGGGLTAGHGSALDLTLGSLDGSQALDLRLTQLEDAQKIKIISRPRIVTRNNQPAVIKSVEIIRIRLPGSTILGGYGTALAFEPIEVGVLLRVRPQVSGDGFILLDLQAVSSALVANQEVDNIPVESERATESHVLLRDGQTLVVGGIYQLQDTIENQGVPYLESLPGLGWLFGESERHTTRTDLVIFVTPHKIPVDPALEAATLPSASQLWLNRSSSGG